MKQIIFLIVSLLMAYSPSTLANSSGQLYGGIQYTLGLYSEDAGSLTVIQKNAHPKAITGKFGKFLHRNFSIEARYGVGLKDSFLTLTGNNGAATDVAINIDSLMALYIVGHITVDKDASIYGLLGATKSTLTFSALGASSSENDSGISFGIGARVNKFDIEYVQYVNESGYKLMAINFGFVVNF